MNIFVLEDDFQQQARIENIIVNLLEKHQIVPKKFKISGKPDQLLQEIEEKGTHQLFFLDIEIKEEELKGLQVAKQIRGVDPYASIVFVTTHSEFMPLSFKYQVSALDYIDKELGVTEFESRIEAALLHATIEIRAPYRMIHSILSLNMLKYNTHSMKCTTSRLLPALIVLFFIPRQTEWSSQQVCQTF